MQLCKCLETLGSPILLDSARSVSPPKKETVASPLLLEGEGGGGGLDRLEKFSVPACHFDSLKVIQCSGTGAGSWQSYRLQHCSWLQAQGLNQERVASYACFMVSACARTGLLSRDDADWASASSGSVRLLPTLLHMLLPLGGPALRKLVMLACPETPGIAMPEGTGLLRMYGRSVG